MVAGGLAIEHSDHKEQSTQVRSGFLLHAAAEEGGLGAQRCLAQAQEGW